MRKLALSLALMGMTLIASAQDIQLPKPQLENKVTLMEALQNRHSSREYSEKQITDSELSTVLWAACGINRPGSGKLTVPSAINAQDILVYVIRHDGAYLYQPKENTLKKVCSKDIRTLVAGRQTFAATAPVSLVLVSNHTKFGNLQKAADRLGVIDAGYVSQNICLACAALGLNTVPRMTMDTEGLRKELGLDTNYDIIINSQIGYSKASEK